MKKILLFLVAVMLVFSLSQMVVFAGNNNDLQMDSNQMLSPTERDLNPPESLPVPLPPDAFAPPVSPDQADDEKNTVLAPIGPKKEDDLVSEEPLDSLILPDEEVPMTDLPDAADLFVDLPEEEIPLANVPATGDPTALCAIISLISGVSFAYISLKKNLNS